MIEKVVVENLREIKDILDKSRIDYWLDFGTLLGAVRGGKMIEWDTDVDLATWYDNLKKIASTFPEFRKRRFEVAVRKETGEPVISRLHCKVDIFLYRETGDYAWNAWHVRKNGIKGLLRSCTGRLIGRLARKTHLKPEGKFLRRNMVRFSSVIPMVVPKHYFKKLSTIQFYGMKFNIPSNAEKYLEYRYGNDWTKPRKKWTYKDDGAIDLSWNWKEPLFR